MSNAAYNKTTLTEIAMLYYDYLTIIVKHIQIPWKTFQYRVNLKHFNKFTFFKSSSSILILSSKCKTYSFISFVHEHCNVY